MLQMGTICTIVWTKKVDKHEKNWNLFTSYCTIAFPSSLCSKTL